MNNKELIISELESTSEDLLSKILQFVKSIKQQQSTVTTNNIGRQRQPNLERGKVVMSDDFNQPLPDSFWLGESE